VDVDLLEADLTDIRESVRHVGRPDQSSWRHHVDRLGAKGEGGVALLHDEDLGVRVCMKAHALTRRHVDEDERDTRAVSFALELIRVFELQKLDSGVVFRCHKSSLCRGSVYGLGMPRRKRKGSGPPPTPKPQSSDQAPGEEAVQVNDQYRGGEPAPDMTQEEQAQHQTGG